MASPGVTEVQALAKILDELDYYQVLEVEPDAPGSAVRSAYHRVSRRFHPDANRHLDAAIRLAVDQIAKRVTEAYSVLRDPKRRRLYDQRRSASTRPERMPLVEAEAEAERQASAELGGRTPNGRRYFTLATGDLTRGDLAAAERNLRTALTFEPDNAFFREKLAEVRAKRR